MGSNYFSSDLIKSGRLLYIVVGQNWVWLHLTDLYDKYGGGGLTHSETIKIDRETVVIIEGNYLSIEEWDRFFDLKILML